MLRDLLIRSQRGLQFVLILVGVLTFLLELIERLGGVGEFVPAVATGIIWGLLSLRLAVVDLPRYYRHQILNVVREQVLHVLRGVLLVQYILKHVLFGHGRLDAAYFLDLRFLNH